MERGYIKLWRKILDNGMIKNSKVLQLAVYCLTKASHKKHKTLVGNQVVELKKGQLVFGRKQASKDLGSSEQSIRTSLKILKKLNFLTSNSTNKFTIITLMNWDIYQCNQPTTNQQPTNNQPTSNQQVTTNKNGQEQQEDYTGNFSSDSIEPPADSSVTVKFKGKPKSVSDEQWGKYLNFSEKFILDQKARHGNIVQTSESRIRSGAKALDNLLRVKGYNKQVVVDVISWVAQDEFWSKNLLSLGSLTKTARNGEIKFANIYFSWKESRSGR